MKRSENTVGQTLHSVQQFLDTNAAVIGPGLETVRATLDVAAANIAAHFVHQDTGGRNALGATQKVKALKNGLRFDHMRPIAEIAQRKLASVPEFKALALPPVQTATTRLITAAQAMANAAQPYAQTFIGLGLSPDFIAQLQAAVNELAQTLATRKQHVSRKTGATAGLAAEVKDAHSIVKLLDSLVRPRIRSNPSLTATWMAATKFRRTSKNAVPALPSTPAAAGSGSGSGTAPTPAPIAPAPSSPSTPSTATPATPAPAAPPAAGAAPVAPATPA